MEKLYIVSNDDIKVEYDENGFYMTSELLKGSYTGGLHNYKCFLKAGSEISPELHPNESVFIMFGKGRGYVCSRSQMNRIVDDVSFYIPDFGKEPYTIHAFTDMEFIFSVVEMNYYDWEIIKHSMLHLPFFLQLSDAVIYDQPSFKGPHTDTYWILCPQQFGRLTCGVVRAVGEGTDEPGHSKVEQWNYCLKDADFNISSGNSPAHNHKAGEWSYVPAGMHHRLWADPGKVAFYVWYEHYTREKDSFVYQRPGEKWTEDGMVADQG